MLRINHDLYAVMHENVVKFENSDDSSRQILQIKHPQIVPGTMV